MVVREAAAPAVPVVKQRKEVKDESKIKKGTFYMSFFYFCLSQKSGICYTVTEVKEIEKAKNVILYIANVRKHVGRELSNYCCKAK